MWPKKQEIKSLLKHYSCCRTLCRGTKFRILQNLFANGLEKAHAKLPVKKMPFRKVENLVGHIVYIKNWACLKHLSMLKTKFESADGLGISKSTSKCECCDVRIPFIRKRFWKFYEVRSERGDFNWCRFWAS